MICGSRRWTPTIDLGCYIMLQAVSMSLWVGCLFLASFKKRNDIGSDIHIIICFPKNFGGLRYCCRFKIVLLLLGWFDLFTWIRGAFGWLLVLIRFTFVGNMLIDPFVGNFHVGLTRNQSAVFVLPTFLSQHLHLVYVQMQRKPNVTSTTHRVQAKSFLFGSGTIHSTQVLEQQHSAPENTWTSSTVSLVN